LDPYIWILTSHSTYILEYEYAEVPEGLGLDVVMTGIRYDSKNDYEAVEKAGIVYDVLYIYCKMRLLEERYRSELKNMDKRSRRLLLYKKAERIRLDNYLLAYLLASF